MAPLRKAVSSLVFSRLLVSHFSLRASEFLAWRILPRVSSSETVSDFKDSLSV